MEIELKTINRTPVFSAPGNNPHWGRVYGATFDKKGPRWLFPAFPPFITKVLHDFVNVYKDIPLSAEASAWVESVGTQDSWDKIARELELPVPSYDHQLQGLAELLYNYRWILQWQMGTGKSKVVIDAISYLKTKTLILCPLIALDNWADEIDLHSGGSLTTLKLNGASKAKKMEQLQSFKDQDILVTTFDTARIYGTPQILPKAITVFQRRNLSPHHALKKILQRLNDDKEQARLAYEWTRGKPPREIKAEIQEITQGKPQWLFDLPYETIVADESHRIKRIQSSRTKICLQLSQKASRRYELSGTLAQGDPRDLFPQLKFLAPYMVPEDWVKFGELFLVKSPRDDRIVIGYKNLHIINARVAEISSEKKLTECVDLPERRFKKVFFDLSPAQRKDYNVIVNTSTIDRGAKDPVEIANGAIRISKLLQLCSGFVYVPEETDICDTCSEVRKCVELSISPGSSRCVRKGEASAVTRTSLRYSNNPKLQVLRELLNDIVLGSKAIVWACFEQELDDIEELLKKQGWGYVRVDGSTTKHIRRLEKIFEGEDACRIYLAQISTGIAITLNSAAYAIYYSRDWSLENREQSLFRNFRIGQTKKTVVYDLCARKSIENQQLSALQSKADISELLTKRIDCVLCSQYSQCLKEEITPWTSKCVLETGADKKIAKARTI